MSLDYALLGKQKIGLEKLEPSESLIGVINLIEYLLENRVGSNLNPELLEDSEETGADIINDPRVTKTGKTPYCRACGSASVEATVDGFWNKLTNSWDAEYVRHAQCHDCESSDNGEEALVYIEESLLRGAISETENG